MEYNGRLVKRLVEQMLVHSHVTLTMNTYAYVMPALQREAADKMEALFEG